MERDLASGQETELYRGVAHSWLNRILLSPDGQQVAWRSPGPEDSGGVVTVAPFPGGEGRVVFSVEPSERIDIDMPVWMPDGRHLLVGTSARRGPATRLINLWRVPVEGGEPERLDLTIGHLDDGSPNGGWVRIRVSPDQRRVVFHSARLLPGAGELLVMENFLSLLDSER